MKKQIALFATIVVASGVSAFGQDWMTIGTATAGWAYDEFTTPGVGVQDGAAGSSAIDVAFLWNSTGATDLLPSVGTSFGQKGGTPTDQVATNGVTSVGSANPLTQIASMLSAGWTLGQNLNSGAGSASLGTVVTTAGTLGTKFGAIEYYNGGASGTPFEFSSSTVAASGGSVTMVMIAWNASAGANYQNASDMGWSNPFGATVGTSSSDSNAGIAQSADSLNQFGVAPVPEPTTLALAGLGGLSMLFLRRRKA